MTEIATQLFALVRPQFPRDRVGLDLSGWKTDDPSSWTANDWILEHRGGDDSSGLLHSSQTFEGTGFVVDVRLNTPESRAAVTAGTGIDVDLASDSIRDHLEKQGRWNRIEASLQEGKWLLEVNGTAVDWDPGPPRKGVREGLLLTASGSVDFCNLYVRDARESH